MFHHSLKKLQPISHFAKWLGALKKRKEKFRNTKRTDINEKVYDRIPERAFPTLNTKIRKEIYNIRKIGERYQPNKCIICHANTIIQKAHVIPYQFICILNSALSGERLRFGFHHVDNILPLCEKCHIAFDNLSYVLAVKDGDIRVARILHGGLIQIDERYGKILIHESSLPFIEAYFRICTEYPCFLHRKRNVAFGRIEVDVLHKVFVRNKKFRRYMKVI